MANGEVRKGLEQMIRVKGEKGNTSESENVETLPVIGAILFHSGKELTIITGTANKISTSHFGEKEFDPQFTNPGSDRILELSQYEGVQVGRIDLGAHAIDKQMSLTRAKKDSGVAVYYEDETGESSSLEIPLDEILKILTGDQFGGITEFSGDNSNPSIALVIPKSDFGNKQVFIGLFIPEDFVAERQGQYLALNEFFQRLNQQFVSFNNREVNRINYAIDQAVEMAEGKELPIDYPFRIQIFKARCCALALLASRTKDKSYLEKLYQILPDLKPSLKNLFAGKGITISQDTLAKIADAPIGPNIITDTPNEMRIVEKNDHNDFELKYKEVQKKLQSDRMRKFSDEYHLKLGMNFYEGTDSFCSEILDQYWKQILSILRDDSNYDESQLLDVAVILTDLKDVAYYKGKYNVCMRERRTDENYLLSETSYFSDLSSIHYHSLNFTYSIPALIAIAKKKAGKKAAQKLGN